MWDLLRSSKRRIEPSKKKATVMPSTDPYFSDTWEPKLEFWLKTKCPSCQKWNFLAVSFKSTLAVDAFECYNCKLTHWLRPKWSVEEMYGHYLKSNGCDNGYDNFDELLAAEAGDWLMVIRGQSKTMSIVK